tara:strand:- start:487 stop:600 length:114 start_codon:yes stop_codon:yes gene_type:complete
LGSILDSNIRETIGIKETTDSALKTEAKKEDSIKKKN